MNTLSPTTSAQFPEETHRRRGSATGGDDVVDDEDAVPGVGGVDVDLQRVCAVLEVILRRTWCCRGACRACGPG
jgi:hypothetical protein